MALATSDLPTLCACIRTKESDADPVDVPWQLDGVSHASFRCLRTMDAVGPDDRVVHALDCRPGRACFEDPDPD